MAQITRGDHFLSGFGNEDYLEDISLRSSRDKLPITNVSENEKQYKIEMGIPGYDRGDLDVNINKSTLTISGNRRENKEESEENYNRQEFNYSTFKKTFKIPDNVEPENISADYKNGLLKIILPKNEKFEDDSRAIEIK